MVDKADDIVYAIRALQRPPGSVEQRIAQFCLDNLSLASTLPITQFATKCGTSTTSIVRFYQSLGYDQILDFRLALSARAMAERATLASFPDAHGDIDKGDSLDVIVHKIAANETLALSDTANTLDIEALAKAIDAIIKAERIDIFGIGASGVVSLDLQHKLARIGLTALSWQESHLAWTSAVTIGPANVAITISHTGATPEVVKYLGLAKQAGATTIAITNMEHSPLAQAADIALVVGARDTAFRSGAFVSRIAQLMVIDCLFIGVVSELYDDSMAAIQKSFYALREDL